MKSPSAKTSTIAWARVHAARLAVGAIALIAAAAAVWHWATPSAEEPAANNAANLSHAPQAATAGTTPPALPVAVPVATPPSSAAVAPIAPTTPDSRWPDAPVLAQARFPTTDQAIVRDVRIVAPPDLAFPVRIEEHRQVDGAQPARLLKRSEMVANRILIRMPEGASQMAVAEELAQHGLALAERVSAIGIWRVNLPATLDGVPEAQALIARLPHLATYSEPDYIVHALTATNDPHYLDESLWGLHNTGQSEGVDDCDIDAPEGWLIRREAPNVIVGVVDTGIRYTHEDLAENMWINPSESGIDVFGRDRATNGIDDDGNGIIDDLHGLNATSTDPVKRGDPMDDNSHGSHVAGTIGAVGNNGLGVTGVAWNVQLMALKFLAAGGSGSSSDAMTCLEYARDNGAHILNNSWGGSEQSQAMLDSIRALRDDGVLFVAAAGNSATNNDVEPMFPAAYAVENVVAVASTTRTGAVSGFSNFGVGSVHVGAPGSEIFSIGIVNDHDYRSMNGTSMASPHVAGILALLAAEYPLDDYAAIINRLLASTTALPSLEGMVATGGQVNLAAALQTLSPAPFNDAFASAAIIASSEADVRAISLHATREAGEPEHAGANGSGSIWWQWTAPAPGTTFVNLANSGFDTRIAVYTGDTIDALTLVAQNDDFEDSPHSRLAFEAEEGVTYRIAVCGANGKFGLVRLNLSGPPENDLFARATIIPNLSYFGGANALNASAEEGEPAHAGFAAKRSLWWKWTATGSMRAIFATGASDFDAVLAVYTSPSANPELADLVPLTANDNNPFSGTWAEVKFDAVAGQTYFIALDHKSGEQTMAWLSGSMAIGNDDFERRLPVHGDAFEMTTMNSRATFEAGEPNHHNSGIGQSLWWEWQPATSGDYVVTTRDSRMFTVLGVYTGDAVDQLTVVGSDYNFGPNMSSQLIVHAVAGQRYQIAVDTHRDAEYYGQINLQIAPIALPANDNFADATVVDAVPAQLTGHNRGATLEAGEPIHEPESYNFTNTVWWKWIPQQSGEFTVSTVGSELPAILTVFSGTSLASLNEIAEDRYSAPTRPAYVRFDVVAATTYYIRLSGYFAATGTIALQIDPFLGVANDHLANAEPLSSNFHNSGVSNRGASLEPREPQHAPAVEGLDPNPGGASIWYKWTPTAAQAGRTVVSTYGTGFGTTVAVYEGPATNPTFPALSLVQAHTAHTRNHAWGEVVWNTSVGKTYYIALDGDYGDVGAFAFTFWVGPPHMQFAKPQVLMGAAVRAPSVVNFAAAKEPNEPNHAGNRGGKSLWWEWTAPASGLFRISTVGSRFDGWWGSNIMDTLLAVYTGNSLLSLTPAAANNDISNANPASEVILNASAGTVYKIAVDGMNSGEEDKFARAGSIELSINPFAGPANDDFANAERVSGTFARVPASLLGASREPGEPSHATKSTRSLWWHWTAPQSGDFFAASTGTVFDAHPSKKPGIAVYTGDAVDALTLVASGSDAQWTSSRFARAKFSAVVGQTYRIAIDDSDSASAHQVQLMLTMAPANDDFANATPLVGRHVVAEGHNLGATEESGEPGIESWKDPASENTSVWWKWTAGASGMAHVDTLGGEVFTIMGVYTGNRVDQLTQIEVHDSVGRAPDYWQLPADKARAGSAQISFDAQAGTTYYFMICGSYYDRSSQGRIVVTVNGPVGTPLATPVGLNATATASNAVRLSWIGFGSEDGFAIERATTGGAFEQIAVTAAGTREFVDSGLEAATQYSYRLRAIGYESSPWTPLVNVRTRFVEAASYETWAALHFTAAQRADPAIAGPLADPDRDGFANQLEFLLLQNPHAPAAQGEAPIALDFVTVDGVRHLTLTFAFSLEATDAILSLQASSDCATWQSIPLDDPSLWVRVNDAPTLNPQRRTLTLRDPLPFTTERLFRLQAQ